jgi:hypothetical protein
MLLNTVGLGKMLLDTVGQGKMLLDTVGLGRMLLDTVGLGKMLLDTVGQGKMLLDTVGLGFTKNEHFTVESRHTKSTNLKRKSTNLSISKPFFFIFCNQQSTKIICNHRKLIKR